MGRWTDAMSPGTNSLVLALGVVMAAALTGCGAKCESSDLQCFLDRMVIVKPEQGGDKIKLVEVDRSKVKGSSGGSGSGSTGSGGPTCIECNGSCVYTANDPNNCGDCGVSCSSQGTGMVCASGTCECPPYRTLCNGECVDLQSDPRHCTGCNVTCNNNTCVNGMCEPSCPANMLLCPAMGVSFGGSWCVDPMTNYGHCGGCNNVCPPAHACSGGSCVCDDPICMDPTSLPSAPYFGGEPLPPITFSEPKNLTHLVKPCTDPNQCTPAVCVSLCDGSDCTDMMCTPPIADGLTYPTWETYMGFLAEPSDTDVTFSTELTPVSAPGCGDDMDEEEVRDFIESQGNAGPSQSFDVTIVKPIEESSSGSGSGGACSGQQAIGNCSVEACSSYSGSTIYCWYETSVGRYDCAANCDCYGAASSIANACSGT